MVLNERSINVEVRGAVAVISFDRPPVNALDATAVAQIAGAAEEVRANSAVGAVVIRGTERAFSAGADLKSIRALLASEGPDAVGDMVERMQSAFTDVERLSVPTVAAIRGAAAGGGLELALACDLRVAASDARIGLPEIGHGLLPGAGGTQRITRVAGPGVASRMMLAGELVDGAAAERLGIVQWAVPSPEVEPLALDLAERMAATPPAAAAIKRCILLAGSEAGYEEELRATRELYATADVQRRLDEFQAR